MQTVRSQTFAPRGVGILRKAFHTSVRRHDRKSRPPSGGFGLCRGDISLTGNEEPPLGAHVVTPRFAYAHHGVYVGGGAVVHYAAFAEHWHRGPVEETFSRASLTDTRYGFARHGPTVRHAQSVRRARSRLGEDRYRFFTNNCEHLSEWCVNGKHRSSQVERLLALARSVSAVLSNFMRLLKATPLRGDDGGFSRSS